MVNSLIIVFICFNIVNAVDIDLFHYNKLQYENVDTKNVTYDINNAEKLFNQFVKDYNKQYKDDEEYNYRYKIFVKNLEHINEKNRKSKSEIHGITKFMDLTTEEFESQYTGLMYNSRRFFLDAIPAYKLLRNITPPEHLDWREHGVITGVKDQGRCSSCWAFSAVGVVEAQHALKHSQLLTLSEQQLVECWPESGGCFTGNAPHLAFNAAARMGGLMLNYDYPQRPMTGQCLLRKDHIAVKIKQGIQIKVRDEEELKKLVHQYGPLSVAVYANKGISTYRAGVFIPNEEDCPSQMSATHAVLLIGYGIENGVPYWIIKNSYSEYWGEAGYLRLIRGLNACSILEYAATAKVE